MSAGDVAAPSYRGLHVVNGVLLVGLWTFTILGYQALPEQVPMHIGSSGVTRWAERGSGMWILLPILGTFHALLMYALSGLAVSSPDGINVPGKKRLLQLPREGQRYAMQPTRPFMFAMSAWLLSLTLLVQWQLFSAAQAGPGAARAPGSSLLLLGYTLLPLPGVWWLTRAIHRRIDEWESRGGPTDPRAAPGPS